MRIITAIATGILLMAALDSSGLARQSKTPPKGVVDLSLSTIGLGSSYAHVRSRLGRPKSDKVIRDDSMGSMDTIRTLEYPGLTVTHYKNDRSGKFSVAQINVKSRVWTVAPGVKIGFSPEQVKGLLGTPDAESDDGPLHRFNYSNAGGDGWAYLEFKHNKLVELGWTYDMT